MDNKLIAQVIKTRSLKQIEDFLGQVQDFATEKLLAMLLDNPVTPPPPLDDLDDPPDTVSVIDHVLDLRSYKNKSFEWIPTHITDQLKGKEVTFSFSGGCGELIVPNGTLTHGEDGNPKNYNQRFYFCGTDFAPGTSENNNYMASIFTAPGCKAAQVRIRYTI